MKTVCAWCGTLLGETHGEHGPSAAVTHGICTSCKEMLLGARGRRLQDILDELDAPVFVVDEQGLVEGANRRALSLVRRSTISGQGTRSPGCGISYPLTRWAAR